MSFVITIDMPRWRANQDAARDAIAAAGAQVVPVAKGNGYGVGNARLAAESVRLGAQAIAVGTVHEAPEALEAQPSLDVLVLEPFTLGYEPAAGAWQALHAHPGAGRIIHTIASPEDAAHLAALPPGPAPHRILLEGLTSMRRFGMSEDQVAATISILRTHIEAGRIVLEGLALHLPIADPERPRVASMSLLSSGTETPEPVIIGSVRVHEVVAWGLLWPNLLNMLSGVRDAGSLWVSHLSDQECTQVRDALPDLPLRLRVGTRLWLGDRGALVARGSVLAVHPSGEFPAAGYHQRRAPKGGTIVVVSGGTSHGVAMTAPRPALNPRQRVAAAGEGALEAAGRFRSPFHLPTGGYAWFLEPPHAHVSMLRLPRGVIPPPQGEFLTCDVRFMTCHPDAILG